MASIQCTQNNPTYTAIQWNGTNQQEMLDFVESIAGSMWQYYQNSTVDQDGTLHINIQYVGVPEIPANGWLVTGPTWGAPSYPGYLYPPSRYTDTEFQARFTTQ